MKFIDSFNEKYCKTHLNVVVLQYVYKPKIPFYQQMHSVLNM